MCSVVFILRSKSVVNRVQVVLSGFSVILFFQAKTLCRHGCMYLFVAGVCRWDVICVGHELSQFSGWW